MGQIPKKEVRYLSQLTGLAGRAPAAFALRAGRAAVTLGARVGFSGSQVGARCAGDIALLLDAQGAGE